MRTRRRSMAIASLAALGLLVTTMPAYSAPVADDDPTLDLSNFELRPNKLGDALDERVTDLDKQLPNVGVGQILADANREGDKQKGAACNLKATGGLDRKDFHGSLCFTPDDNSTSDWYPQGVTTVADAQDDQRWGKTNQPVLVSWYDNSEGKKDEHDCNDQSEDPEKGVRVSFMNPRNGKYRHVLLVYPTVNSHGNPTYMSVRGKQVTDDKEERSCSLHAGGILWYGNFLYVADTARGFRVFDMRHIYDLGTASNGTTKDPNKIGRHDGTYYGHGARYVMPQVASWTSTAPAGERCTKNDRAPSFSNVSLDRSGRDHVVVGEYCKNKDETNGRVAAWKIAGATNAKGEQITDTGYRWKADVAHKLPNDHIQGVTRFNGRWYLSKSKGADSSGRLLQTTKDSNSREQLIEADAQLAAIGPEDLSHWQKGTGGTTLGHMWTVSEHPGKRMVYAIAPEQQP